MSYTASDCKSRTLDWKLKLKIEIENWNTSLTIGVRQNVVDYLSEERMKIRCGSDFLDFHVSRGEKPWLVLAQKVKFPLTESSTKPWFFDPGNLPLGRPILLYEFSYKERSPLYKNGKLLLLAILNAFKFKNSLSNLNFSLVWNNDTSIF